jgi:hypothetical protein
LLRICRSFAYQRCSRRAFGDAAHGKSSELDDSAAIISCGLMITTYVLHSTDSKHLAGGLHESTMLVWAWGKREEKEQCDEATAIRVDVSHGQVAQYTTSSIAVLKFGMK